MRRTLASPNLATSSKRPAAMRGDVLSASMRMAKRGKRFSSAMLGALMSIGPLESSPGGMIAVCARPHHGQSRRRAKKTWRPDAMIERRSTVEHAFGTLKFWMGSAHFLMKRLGNVRTEMSLHVLSYNMKRVVKILGVPGLLQAMRAWSPKKENPPFAGACNAAPSALIRFS